MTCILLYFIVFYCILLYFIAFYCISLHFIVFYCILLHFIVFYCILLSAFVALYTKRLIKTVTKPAAIPQRYARPRNTQPAGKKLNCNTFLYKCSFCYFANLTGLEDLLLQTSLQI